MTELFSVPTLEQLKQAVTLAEKIEALQTQLVAALTRTTKGRGRPGKPKVDVEGFIAAATAALHGKPAKPGRGRPPKAVNAAKAPAAGKTRKKRVMSEEGRRRIIEAQKKRWAAARKAARKA